MSVRPPRPMRIPELELDVLVCDEDGEDCIYDDAGSRWTRTTYENPDRSICDTFGPGHPSPPSIVKFLRELQEKDSSQ